MDRVEWVRCLVLKEGHVDTNFLADIANSAFALRVADGNATFTWKIDLPTAEYAERHLNTFLTSFECDLFFQSPTEPRRELRPAQIHMRSGRGGAFLQSITLNIVGPRAEANHRIQYPWLHHRYESDPLIAALVERYQTCRAGRELLAVTAYFCLSALEHSAADESRKRAREAFCERFKIARSVRDMFGELDRSCERWRTSRLQKRPV